MMLCPGFVIKSPSSAVPPASPAHIVFKWRIFFEVHLLFSEIRNVDVLYFLWPVVQWGKKMNVASQCLLCSIFCDKGKEEGVKLFCVAMGTTLSM